MAKLRKNRENALRPIRILVQIAAELGSEMPSEPVSDAQLKRVIKLALRFSAFETLGLRRDTRHWRHAVYHWCCALIAMIYAIAHANYLPEDERSPIPIIHHEPYILRRGRLVPEYNGTAEYFLKNVAKIFLQARNLERVRICLRCGKIFYAPRERSFCCSLRCTNAVRQSRARKARKAQNGASDA